MKAKYALRAMMVLAGQEGKTMQSKSIAKSADAPVKFLEAILLELKQHGFVTSKRGIFGGYYLQKSPNDIMVGDIVRKIDGMLAPIPCASVNAYKPCEDCEFADTCVIRMVMTDVRNAIADVLDKRSLSEMLLMQASRNARIKPV